MENINSEVVEMALEGKLDNASWALIRGLKADIKSLTEKHVARKRAGYQDHSESQEIRAHLIAYCLLRDKSYSVMESKCSEFNPGWWDWRILIRNVNKVCMKYSIPENHEKWTVTNVEKIIAEARAND